MNEPGPVSEDDRRLTRPVFVSYASADRKDALKICEAIERRGMQCWISCRDVPPGENYQEAIVRSLRDSRAMVLVFSEAANNSDEIKKELSLASRFHVSVMALRTEDVEPNDAFAYELSTRQWIDAFESWDRSIDALVQHIGRLSSPASPAARDSTARARPGLTSRRGPVAAAAALLIVALGAAAWWLLRPAPAAAHSMMVRLTGFSRLSTDLPAGMPDAIRDEIIAAFNDDGVVGVSTAAAPPVGTGPAYAIGGTVRRDGDQIKVNVRLTNERSGATLWSNIFTYTADEAVRVPRHVAVDAGKMVRCGLFAASTYSRPLSDPVFTDYLGFCHNSGEVQFEPGKALDLARKVVAATPDFSWGWSAVSGAAFANTYAAPVGARADDFRKESNEAADKAIALDKSNSEALMTKALLVDPRDYLEKERLFKAALAARALACGCEHHNYGAMLQAVGRNADAVEEYRRSTDVIALDTNSQLSLADALMLQGRPDEARTHIDAAIDLSSDPAVRDDIAVYEATVTGDYAGALKAIADPKLDAPAPLRAAIQVALQALVAGDSSAKARAAPALVALPPDMQGRVPASLLGALGANREALQQVASGVANRRYNATGWLFVPSMSGALRDPSFPALADRLGLMKYWRATKTRPDVCAAAAAPPVCRMI